MATTLAALEQHRAVAEARDRAHVVRDEQDRPALVLEALELLVALLLERGVADGEHLVDQQHVGLDLDRGREREPDVHARGVVLELEVLELLELGELEDRADSAAAASLRERPSIVALTITLSRAASSGLKPTPSSMNVPSRPRTSTLPTVGS